SSPSSALCAVRGPASTMPPMPEPLGTPLPGNPAPPAPDSGRLALDEATGKRIVEMVAEDLRPSRILTQEAFENAIRVDMAIGGSTNAIVHLPAIAGRGGGPLPLSPFDRLSRGAAFIPAARAPGT